MVTFRNIGGRMSILEETRPDAGWYPDPRDGQRMRWWDGSRWTDHVASPPGARRKHAGLGWLMAITAILAVLVVLGLASGLPARLAQPGGAMIEDPTPVIPEPTATNATDLASAYLGSVTVKASCGPGCGAMGGAVAISEDELLTAAHLVAEGATVLVATPSGKAMLAQVLDVDTRRDLALLQTPTNHGLPIVALRSEAPVIGEPAHAVGTPGGQRRISDGVVTKVLDMGNDGVTEVQTNADIDLGNSGGPLLDDQGRLLGIVVKEHETDDSIGWATSANDIAVFLANAARSGSVPPTGQPLPGSREYDAMLRDLFDGVQD